jgi:superfamily I DNA/RNA helicase
MTLPSHTQVILGPPGTGKTSTLLGLIEDELESGTEPESIGFFTFTKKAVNEGKERAMNRFSITNKQLPFFRTLHSLAFRQLGLTRESVLSNSDIYDLNEKLNLRLTGRSSSEDGHLFGMTHDDRLAFIENLARMRDIPLKEQWHEVDDAVGWFELERYARGLKLFKEDRLLVDYTDMLQKFLTEGDVPTLEVMFVDEAQDLSPLQWAEWKPRTEEGMVRWEPSIDLINMDEGEWLILARTNYLLEDVDEHCRNEGWFFEVKGRPSISEAKVRAVVYWERLLKGETVSLNECANILKYIKIDTPKKLETLDSNIILQYEDLKSHFPDLPQGRWYDAFNRLTAHDVSYIRAMLRRGEKITKKPRIRLSTIHAAKGGESNNVVLLTDITTRVYKNYQQNPDEENRVFYVGVTRTKENLYLIEPKTTRCYQI